jgi:hypothetical protein
MCEDLGSVYIVEVQGASFHFIILESVTPGEEVFCFIYSCGMNEVKIIL